MGADLLAAEAAARAAVEWRRARDGHRAEGGDGGGPLRRSGDAGAPRRSGPGRRSARGAGRDPPRTGCTNPDIAAQLHLSRRTVGNYLCWAHEKLGIFTRDELPLALDPS
jgi:hypothetical protein